MNTIKQIGEKGPIHTIPAPNLSLRDKPTHINDVRKEVNYPQTTAFIQVEQSHHYQVTEAPESGNLKFSIGQQQLHQQQQQLHQQQQQFHQHQLQQQHLMQQQQQFQQIQQQKQQEQLHQQHLQQQQQLQQQKLLQYQQHISQQQFKQQQPFDRFQQQTSQSATDIQVQPQQVYLADETEVEIHPETLQQDHITHISQERPQQGNNIVNNRLTSKDLYQLLGNAYPQGSVPGSSLQTIKFQSDPEFTGETVYQQNDEYDLDAESTINSEVGNTNFKPEFQSFNYDEQAHQASQKELYKKGLSSLVTATYTLSPGNVFERHGQVEDDDSPHADIGSRSDINVNGVEDEKIEEPIEEKKAEEKLIQTPYYSSLPNKEAAERLADLQAAGKINHNLMELSKSRDDMAIFIADDNDALNDKKTESDVEGHHNYPDAGKEVSMAFDDLATDNGKEEDADENAKEFGTRIRPKNST